MRYGIFTKCRTRTDEGAFTDSYSEGKATTTIGGPKGTGKGTMS